MAIQVASIRTIVEQSNPPEDAWLCLASELLQEFEDTTGCTCEIGAYWAYADRQYPSLNCRVRSKQACPDVMSNEWEGCFCAKICDGRVSAEILAFPFLEKKRVSSEGVMQNITDDMDVNDFRLFQFCNGSWIRQGWHFGDGPGEWNHIRRPDDAFFRVLQCSVAKPAFDDVEPIALKIPVRPEYKTEQPPIRISLERVGRNSRWENLVPLRTNKFFRRSQQLCTATVDESVAVVDLRTWKIRGGWRKGRYSVSLSAQGICWDVDSVRSDLSPRIEFRIE